MSLLFWMIVGHAVCDYPLQGDFLARGKNHKAPIPGIDWWICLMAHSVIHAGAVVLVTGNLVLGLAEFWFHCVIDYGKCDGHFDFKVDQALHIICKICWTVVLTLVAL